MDFMDSMGEVDNARQGFVHVGHREFRSSAGPNPHVDTGRPCRYAGDMSDSANHRDGCANAGEPGTVGGFLTAALNMEDQISRGMYEDYMDRATWPAELDEKTFEQIRKRLTTLVEDTKKHSKILQALVREHAKSK